jgi:diaminopimelate decarboxylase
MLEIHDGILHIGGLSAPALAEKYGEPLYVYDGDAIEDRVRTLRSLLPQRVELLYSMKANPNPAIVELLSGLTDGVDVSSLREMAVARRSGFDPDRIFFVGPSKSKTELGEAARLRIGCLVVESAHELALVDRIACELGTTVNVALRVNPDFEVSGSKLKMGGAPRQFGIDEEQIPDVIDASRDLDSVRLIGLHCYVGTRILDWQVAVRNTQEILSLAARVSERTGLDLRLVDVGGGLGVPYFPGEHSFDLKSFAAGASEAFHAFAERRPGTRIVMELGRFLVGEAGIYLTKVRYVKRSRGHKFVLVSGGMNHHQATTSVGSIVKSHFPIQVVNRMEPCAVEPAFVCGPLCTPADVLGRAVELPEQVEPGDLIGILNSGAYGLTASPVEFLSHAPPGEVLARDGRDYLIRRPPAPEEFLVPENVSLVTEDRRTIHGTSR